MQVTALSLAAATGNGGAEGVAHSSPTDAVVMSDGPLTVNRSVLEFRDLRIGQAQALTLTVANDSSTPQAFNGLVITGPMAGDFKPTTTCWQRRILPHRTCTITVRFAPTAAGLREAELRLFDEGGAGPVVLLLGAGH